MHKTCFPQMAHTPGEPVLEEKLVPVGFSSTPFSGIASTLLPLVRYSYFRNLLLT